MSRGSNPVFASLLSLSLLLAGCGGGGGSSDSLGGTGSLTVTLTDSPAHDVSRFTVDVTAITLTSTETTVVNGLKHAITLDLASLTRISQVVSIQAIDSGHYTSASITFDFTNSSCFLVDQTTEATLLDDDGAPLAGTVTLPIDLSAMPTVVQGGGRYELELDFDLDQSLTIDPVANSVSVAPSVVVRTNRADAHVNVAMGALATLDAASMSATMDLQTPSKFSLGPARVNFSTSTIFQVDGVPALGNAGVTLLGSKPVGTWAQVFVAVNPVTGTSSIAYVEAGKGTFNGGQALIEGVIVDRGDSGANKLFTVHGRSTSADHSTELFNTDFQVTTKPGVTRVVRDTSSSTTFTIDSLNVGQRVQAYGTLTGTVMDATATTAIVRAEPTSLFAFANSAVAAGNLEVDLVRTSAPLARTEEIEVETVSSPFAWGADNSVSRDANSFDVDVSLLGSLPLIAKDDPVRMDVFFSNVNSGTFDATAFTFAKLSDTSRLLSLRDRPNGMTLTTQVVGTQIEFTVNATALKVAGERAALDRGLLGFDDLTDGTVVLVGPGATAVSYTLQDVTAGTVKTFPTFGAFVTAFEAALTGGSTVKDFIAAGSFDVGSGTLSATTVTAIVK
jgi:hypothetical protein